MQAQAHSKSMHGESHMGLCEKSEVTCVYNRVISVVMRQSFEAVQQMQGGRRRGHGRGREKKFGTWRPRSALDGAQE